MVHSSIAPEVDWAVQGGETRQDAGSAAGRIEGMTGGASAGGGKAEVAADGPAFERRSDEVDEPGRGGGGGANPLPVEGAGGGTFPGTALPFAGVAVGVAAEGPAAGGGSAKVVGGYGFAPFGLDRDGDGRKAALPEAVVVVPAAAPCPSAGAI